MATATKAKPTKREVEKMRQDEAKERLHDQKRAFMSGAKPPGKVADGGHGLRDAKAPMPPIRAQLMELCKLRGPVTDLELFQSAVGLIREQQEKLDRGGK